MDTAPARRGRPLNVIAALAEQQRLAAEAGDLLGTPEPEPEPEPEVVEREPMRVAVREEDPRTRAARRAEELRNHLGDLDATTDDFYIDPAVIPPGWSYEWKRKTILGEEDPAYQVQLAHTGWEPVPASRHPTFMPSNSHHTTIERKGMILMERPAEITEEIRNYERKKARSQVMTKEEQLNSAPDGQFGRDHAEVRPRINKSYEAIPIPQE